MLVELLDAQPGHLHAPAPFELERRGGDGYDDGAGALGLLGDHGRDARAGAAAHAHRDEGEVAVAKNVVEGLQRILHALLAHVGEASRPKPPGQPCSDEQPPMRINGLEMALVGVYGHRLHSLDAHGHQPVDAVASPSAAADHVDPELGALLAHLDARVL